METTDRLIKSARQQGTVVPAFNIPYLPMLEPTVQALRDTGCFGLIMVARLEWVKFAARSLEAVAEEYWRVGDRQFTRLHLDHVPVIDEDQLRVDYVGDITRALAAGYESVMVDGSRLSIAENIAATRQIVELAHARGVAVEGELGRFSDTKPDRYRRTRNYSRLARGLPIHRKRLDLFRQPAWTGCLWRWVVCTGRFRQLPGMRKKLRPGSIFNSWKRSAWPPGFRSFCMAGPVSARNVCWRRCATASLKSILPQRPGSRTNGWSRRPLCKLSKRFMRRQSRPSEWIWNLPAAPRN